MKKSVLVFCLFMLFYLKVFPQDFWQRSAFPTFYSREILAIDAHNNLVLAASYPNGLGLSTDCGEHWMPTGILQPYSSVAVSNSGYLFAIGYNGVLYRSIDTGSTWVECSSILFYNGPRVISSINDFIYVGSYQGIYRSTNSGETWTEQNNGLFVGGSSPFTRIAESSNGILAATTPSGVFKSTNNANSWVRVSSVGATNIAVNSLGYIFADKYSEEPYYYSPILYKSTDNGASWHELKPWWGSFIFINPVNDAVIIADFNYTKDYSLSTNNGLTWNTIIVDRSPKCMTYNYNGSYFMGTNDAGIFKSNSLLGSWQSKNVGFPGSFSQVTSLLCYGGTIYAGTGSFGLYSSSDNGISFNKLAANLLSIIKIGTTSNGNLFVVNGTIVRSTDNGNSWFDYPPPGVLYDLITSSLCSQGSIVMTGGYRGDGDAELDRSTDNGNTWTEVLTIPGNYPERNSVICLAMHNDGIVLGCVENIKSNSVNYGMIRSTDSGLTWSSVNVDLQPVPQIRDFAWDSNNSVFAATSQGLLRSIDNGLSWFYTNGVLPTVDIRCLVINSNNSIYIGTGNKGVFRSADNLVTWNILNVGISDTVINTISIGSEGYLFAGTERDGVFRSREPITSINNENEVRFGTYNLSQNFPNPFNPTTKIEYSILQTSFVTLKVYDVLGREVATLVNEEKTAGNYEIEFNGNGLTSGIYFYEMKSGSFIETKKLLLLK